MILLYAVYWERHKDSEIKVLVPSVGIQDRWRGLRGKQSPATCCNTVSSRDGAEGLRNMCRGTAQPLESVEAFHEEVTSKLNNEEKTAEKLCPNRGNV